MSLPAFKFTSLGAPTNNESVNSGLSSASKMEKSGIISTIRNKAQDTFKDIKMPDISLDLTSKGSDDIDTTDSSSGGFFSLATLIKVILAAVIIWFMWSSLSTNGDFHLGMGDISSFFKSMEEKGREFISRFTNNGVTPSNRSGNNDTGNDESSDSDSDSDIETEEDPYNAQKAKEYSASSSASSSAPSSAPSSYHPPVPPPASNSSDKQPGFVNDDTKYTFLDKADRSYTGPAPRADDSTSVTQKHQTGKGGYCYIGEDRGFRSCVQVEPSDKCMSGQVFSRHDICVNPTLRE
jgi:hypothetical protein